MCQDARQDTRPEAKESGPQTEATPHEASMSSMMGHTPPCKGGGGGLAGPMARCCGAALPASGEAGQGDAGGQTAPPVRKATT